MIDLGGGGRCGSIRVDIERSWGEGAMWFYKGGY